jgi:hypothetical protein
MDESEEVSKKSEPRTFRKKKKEKKTALSLQ